APEHLQRGIGDILGNGAERRRWRPFLELLPYALALLEDRLPIAAAGGDRACGPREADLLQGEIGFGVMKVEEILRVGDHAPARQQSAEFAQLVEPDGREPVFAIELVILDKRENKVTKSKHLIEGAALLVCRQQTAI